MPRNACQTQNWDFAVKPERLYLSDGKATRIFGNVRTDTNQVVGVVSEKNYGLIQNRVFVDTIREALNGLGLTGYREEVLALGPVGEKLVATYHFDGLKPKKLAKVGDEIGLVLRFGSSFDCKTSAWGELMAKILRCLNGMVLEEGQFKLQRRHTANISLDFVKDVTEASIKRFDEAIQVFDRLAEVSVTDEQGLIILKNLGISKRIQTKVGHLWGTPSFSQGRERTLYALYDAATEYLRDLAGSRLELASKVNRMVLRGLVGGLTPEGLAALVTPPVIEVETVVSEVETMGEVIEGEIV